jgi:predicted transcriptional regulator
MSYEKKLLRLLASFPKELKAFLRETELSSSKFSLKFSKSPQTVNRAAKGAITVSTLKRILKAMERTR